ncbi:hypothetical protein MHYP_G00203630 [Metynnis hypsauchen]
MAQLQHWCKGEGIDLDHALLVKDIPEDAKVGFIEETLQSIKALGRDRVELKLPKNMAGSTEPITALALVCLDPRCSDSTPVLVDTNVCEICPLNSVTKPRSQLYESVCSCTSGNTTYTDCRSFHYG